MGGDGWWLGVGVGGVIELSNDLGPLDSETV